MCFLFPNTFSLRAPVMSCRAVPCRGRLWFALVSKAFPQRPPRGCRGVRRQSLGGTAAARVPGEGAPAQDPRAFAGRGNVVRRLRNRWGDPVDAQVTRCLDGALCGEVQWARRVWQYPHMVISASLRATDESGVQARANPLVNKAERGVVEDLGLVSLVISRASATMFWGRGSRSVPGDFVLGLNYLV